MSNIEYHEGYLAVEVKDNKRYISNPNTANLIDTLGAEIAEDIYNGIQYDFWHFFAPEIAQAYGYGKVYSEGRSDGWLIVENPPTLDSADYDNIIEGEEVARKAIQRWEEFIGAIDELVEQCQKEYPIRMMEKLEDIRNEKSERQYNENRDIITVERIPF